MKVKYRENKSLGLLISNTGKVYKEVGQWHDKDGYPYITWHRKNLPVHRLVAEQFVAGRTDETPIVMHKDDNPRNSSADNLEWGTYSQNNYDAVTRGLRKKRIRPVRCMETGEEFQSARDAAVKMFGIPKRGDRIIAATQGERGKAYGYHWEEVVGR